MNDANINSPGALIEQAKQQRERLVDQIVRSQKTIAHSREIIARIDQMLSAVDKKRV
jgi:hypothetical protein